MLISAPGGRGKGKGSLSIGAPTGIVTELRPSNVKAWIEPGLTLAASLGSATVAAPITTGAEPYSLETNADLRSSDRNAHALSHGLAIDVEQRLFWIRRHWLRARCPGSDPGILRSRIRLHYKHKKANEDKSAQRVHESGAGHSSTSEPKSPTDA